MRPPGKLLVLGAAGQLGGDLMDAAAAAGVPAQGAGRAEVDVTDRDALRAFLAVAEFDVLVNATSYHKTDEVAGRARHGGERPCAGGSKNPSSFHECDTPHPACPGSGAHSARAPAHPSSLWSTLVAGA